MTSPNNPPTTDEPGLAAKTAEQSDQALDARFLLGRS